MQVESGIQLFTRLSQRPMLENLHPNLFPDGHSLSNQIIEITGPPCTGKTLLVTDILARCLLPKSLNNVALPGKDSSAVMINTDHHFDLFRLISVIESYLVNDGKKVSSVVKQQVIEKCLGKLVLLNCYSNQQFQATLLNLESILLEKKEITLVVMDSIAAYYWSERFNSNVSFNVHFGQIIKSLDAIVQRFNIVVFYTKPETPKEENLKKVDYRIKLNRVNAEELTAEATNLLNNDVIKCDYSIGKRIVFL